MCSSEGDNTLADNRGNDIAMCSFAIKSFTRTVDTFRGFTFTKKDVSRQVSEYEYKVGTNSANAIAALSAQSVERSVIAWMSGIYKTLGKYMACTNISKRKRLSIGTSDTWQAVAERALTEKKYISNVSSDIE